jgi:glucose-1-phosphate adenylyltransferase
MATIAIIMGGGRGTRLHPLTVGRSKPAVPIAGQYRLIDIPITNCIRSGLRRIYVLTQFQTASLHRHIMQTYRFDTFSDGVVEIRAAQQTAESAAWYQGTADAVRKNMDVVQYPENEHVLILSGDQLYRMDFSEMMRAHHEAGAQITIAAMPVPREEVSSFGILRRGSDGQIEDFAEKPTDPEILRRYVLPADSGEERRGKYLASLGIYLFDRDVLVEALDNDLPDFGKNVIPMCLKQFRTHVFMHDGYWEDIGRIGTFFHANMALCDPVPKFDLFTPGGSIYTHPRYLPPAKIEGAEIDQSLIAGACQLIRCRLKRSLIGMRSRIEEGSQLEEVITMGRDSFEVRRDVELARAVKGEPLGIGRNVTIRRAILDKNVRVGDGVTIEGREGRPDEDGDGFFVRDGIVVIPKSTVIEPGRTI